MFKFVHIADTHLDSAIKSNEKNQKLIIDEIEKAFKRSIDLCIDEKCHAFLISGDLFDDERLSFKTELMLRDSFERLDKYSIRVFYALGNHDSKSSKIRRSNLGENVYIFDDETPEAVAVKDTEGNDVGIVTGVGYRDKKVEYNLSNKFDTLKNETGIPIVAMLHTSLDVGGDGVYAPCTYNDLKVHGFDYWALGHIHKSAVYGKDKPAVFPGCTCGRDFGETGKKGAYLVELNKSGVSKYNFVELAGIAFSDIQLSGFENANDAGDMMEICTKHILNTTDTSKKNIVRITITGQCPMYGHLSSEDLTDLAEAISRQTGTYVTLRNNLTSFINPDDYINDKHLLSVTLNMAKRAKEDDGLKEQIIEALSEKYKGLDGDNSKEYIDSLFENIENRICDVMINQED